MSKTTWTVLLVAGLVAGACAKKSAKKDDFRVALEPVLPADGELRSLDAFASIADEKARSVALMEEMGKVILHPRCVNCHPAGDRPLQGDLPKPHIPLVQRGDDNHGVPAMECTTCHGPENFRNVPGNPKWHLAPLEMAWEGRTLGEICQQMKDTERNGGKSIPEIVHHLAEDELVAYGWNPPAHLEAVPGNQKLFGQLAQAWADTGGHCP